MFGTLDVTAGNIFPLGETGHVSLGDILWMAGDYFGQLSIDASMCSYDQEPITDDMKKPPFSVMALKLKRVERSLNDWFHPDLGKQDTEKDVRRGVS